MTLASPPTPTATSPMGQVRSFCEAMEGRQLGDRVAAIAGNNVEAVVGALATAAVGATFSSAAPEMGVPALLSRFEQVAPKLLMANLADEEAPTELSKRIGELARSLPSLTAILAFDDGPRPTGLELPVEPLTDAEPDGEASFERFPFNHPLFILFSSGTTGRPKCIVHGAGGRTSTTSGSTGFTSISVPRTSCSSIPRLLG